MEDRVGKYAKERDDLFIALSISNPVGHSLHYKIHSLSFPALPLPSLPELLPQFSLLTPSSRRKKENRRRDRQKQTIQIFLSLSTDGLPLNPLPFEAAG